MLWPSVDAMSAGHRPALGALILKHPFTPSLLLACDTGFQQSRRPGRDLVSDAHQAGMPAARTSTAEFNHQCRARGGIEDAEQAGAGDTREAR